MVAGDKGPCYRGSQEAEDLQCRLGSQGDGDRWGWDVPEIYNHLHCLKSIDLQVVLSTPGH